MTDSSSSGSEEKPPTGFPEPSEGGSSDQVDPHHALNNPAEDPDPTEWPDPYETREDPRYPRTEDDDPPHPQTGATSTSAPHPSQDPEAEPWEGPKRDKVDQ
jgi:hypothetical protein